MASYVESVIAHRLQVSRYLHQIAQELMERGNTHDRSKLGPEELPLYEKLAPQFATVTYGSIEYQGLLDELGPALAHHYAHNRHHPEHHDEGIAGMNLVDIVEMVCDWLAVMAASKSDITHSLTINANRFGIDSQLLSIINTTIYHLKDGID